MTGDDEPVIRISAVDPSAPAKRAKVPALGRGLGALLGDSRREEPLASAGGAATGKPDANGLAMLALSEIRPDPRQPRRHFDQASLDELASSIAQRGLIQPVIVRPMPGGGWQLVAGERRWRAAQRAQIHEIPALIRDLGEREVVALALIENLQREDLNPIEEARAYHRLAEEEGLSQAEIARMVDKSRSHIANLQRLLLLPEEVITLVETGELSMGHARALIGAGNAIDLAGQAVAKQLSVRDIERIVRRQSRAPGEPRRPRAARDPVQDADIAAVERHLEDFIGLPVKITADIDPRSGTVAIRYRTLDQLDLICQRLTGGGI